MERVRVEAICSHLTPLLITTIRTKILKHVEPPVDYLPEEALVFWLVNNLIGTKILTSEQVRFVVEEVLTGIYQFGQLLWQALQTTNDIKKLPVCKFGILDRRYACMDGIPFFIQLSDGSKQPAVEEYPLETLAYNLTTLFIRYKNIYELSRQESDVRAHKTEKTNESFEVSLSHR